MDLLEGKKLITRDSKSHYASKHLKTKKIIVYFFSASWVSSPELLQNLKYLYEENIKRKTGIEVIYVSADTDENAFQNCFHTHHGPWSAIPFRDVMCDELRWMYDITCLPQLVVVRKDGFVISRRGREELEKLGINVLVTWTDHIP